MLTLILQYSLDECRCCLILIKVSQMELESYHRQSLKTQILPENSKMNDTETEKL